MNLLLLAVIVDSALALPGDSAPGFQPRMGEPMHDLTPAQRADFDAGRAAFERFLTPAEGLGPAFNDISCGLCHIEPTSGGFSERTVTLFGAAGPPFDPLTRFGGPLLQAQATVPDVLEFIPPEADVYTVRATPHLFGAGLVERIPDWQLLSLEARCAPTASGPSGRAQLVTPLEDPDPRVGRFGWKSQIATLASFTADAARNELGMTSSLLPDEARVGRDEARSRTMDRVADPEDEPGADGRDRIQQLVAFQRLLAPPPQTPLSGMRGERVFDRIGCADCHVPSFTVPPSIDAALPAITFKPYSDFLLHDVGALGDGIVQGIAGPSEMRTAPLWGLAKRRYLGHDAKDSGATLDARVDAIVMRHDGEARNARDAYGSLAEHDRTMLFAFLASLGRAEFDADADDDVDAADWNRIAEWLTEPSPAPAFDGDAAAAIADVDQDGDFDLRDVGVMQRAFTGDDPAATRRAPALNPERKAPQADGSGTSHARSNASDR